MTHVFGEERADALLRRLLLDMDVESIETLDHLSAVAEALKARSGFEATVGGMLAVDAAMLRLRASS